MKNTQEQYSCKDCMWKGLEDQLEYDVVDTCFGDDKIELCPKCGSMDLVHINYSS